MKKLLLFLLTLLFAAPLHAQIDPAKWYVLDGIKDDANWCHFSSNAAEANGLLTLTETSGTYTCAPGGTSVPHATGMIFSDPFYFTYGVAKASIKFGTAGNTIYSAFWMWGGPVGSPGYPPTCIANVQVPGNTMNACTVGSSTTVYEIDIAEDAISSTNVNQNYITWSNGTSNIGVCSGGVAASSDIGAGFHTYELDWFSSVLVFRIDGAITKICNIAVNQPMFLIFDQEQPGTPATTTNVNWVRVCSDPNATCNVGDPTMIFDDEFNAGVVPVPPINHAMQGKTLQGGALQ